MENQDNQSQSVQQPSLGVQDMVLMYQVLRVIASRGAIKADEMQEVGGLFNRLESFLTSAGLIKQASPEPTGDNKENSND
jgi:hypothetical protein